MFTPSRLTLARERRARTKTRLAADVGLSLRSITGFESGEITPSALTITQLAEALKFPPSFFEADEVEEISDEAVSFRSLRKMTASQRRAAIAAGALAFDLHDWIVTRFRLPGASIPRFEPGIDPEIAAELVRAEWRLGSGPIPNVVHLLEAHGVRVFSLAQDSKEVDAFSLWRNGHPFVFLNTMKSGERSRFDAAHELAHLVLHSHHTAPQGKQAEREAQRFASAFLMPAASVMTAVPRYPTLEDLREAKAPWRVSVAALTYRLHEIRAVTDWQYRTLTVQLSERGWRTDEPRPIRREASQILNKVFAALRKEGTSKADVARAMHVFPEDLDPLVFNLAMLPLSDGNAAPAAAHRAAPPALRLVGG